MKSKDPTALNCMVKDLFLALVLASSCRAAEKMERWVYIPANFQVDAEAARV